MRQIKRKSATVNIKDYIDTCTKDNGGKPTKLVSINGAEMDFTLENWNKIKSKADNYFNKVN